MKKLICVVYLVCPLLTFAQKSIRLASPDGNISFTFQLQNRKAIYNVAHKGKSIIDNSALSLSFDDGNFDGSTIQINKPIYREGIEDYQLPVGKASQVRDRFKEVRIPLQQTQTPHHKIDLVVRAFNDGVAFRYEFPQQQNWSTYTLLDENTTFKISGNPTAHTLFLPNYTTSHEGPYSSLPLSNIKEDTLMDTPTLFEFPDKKYLAITEAALLDYAGMYLSKHEGVLKSTLSPLPNQNNVKVKASLPHHTPWRVLMISDRIGALIESNIITNLNEPSKIKDVSWLKPGKTTWPWWNGNTTPDTTFAPGNNFETNQYYIDFCARNGIEYHSVVEYGTKEWYWNDGIGVIPGPNVDAARPVPGLDMKQLCDYAKKKGVDIRVWVHWGALYPAPKIDSAFAAYERWGIKGMMVDFMDRDDQEMVNIQTEILEKAAKYHLHVQFHGAYKPTGLSRTYPNEFTREGTLNYEADKWVKTGITPDHDLYMPFTRMLGGPTDYHLGGFRAVPPSKFRVQFTKPLVLGTRCHMLAMYVVLESYLSLVSDYPAAYHGQPGFEFIKKVPTVWDETKVLDAKVGEYVIIARRKNEDWYIGMINNHDGRQLSIPLTFLKEGQYTADIYTDADDVAENPNHLIKQTKTVTSKDVISIKAGGGGGAAMHVRKQ